MKLDYDVLRAIRRYRSEHGYSPTVRELCAMTDRPSTGRMYHALRNLEKGGLVTRTAWTARSTIPTARGELFMGSEKP